MSIEIYTISTSFYGPDFCYAYNGFDEEARRAPLSFQTKPDVDFLDCFQDDDSIFLYSRFTNPNLIYDFLLRKFI